MRKIECFCHAGSKPVLSNLSVSLLQHALHLLASERIEASPDLGELFISAWNIHAPKRGLQDIGEELLHFLLLLSGRIPDGAFTGCVAHIELVWLVLIRRNDVDEHVDNKGSILTDAVLSHFYIRIDGSHRRNIIRYNLVNFV